MNLDYSKVAVPLWLIYVIGLASLAAALGVWYYRLDPGDTKLVSFVGNIVTGLLVYLLTFLTLLRPLQELDHFRRMGVKDLLANRHDQSYYRSLLTKTRLRVDVMGASCSRFVNDFLDVESDDKVLVDALTNNPHLKVRLLIPTDDYMSEDARARAARMFVQFAAAKKHFGNQVELMRFNHHAHHSFVLADGELVVGPVFDDDKSRHAPAVHVSAETIYGQKYRNYFDSLWKECRAST